MSTIRIDTFFFDCSVFSIFSAPKKEIYDESAFCFTDFITLSQKPYSFYPSFSISGYFIMLNYGILFK